MQALFDECFSPPFSFVICSEIAYLRDWIGICFTCFLSWMLYRSRKMALFHHKHATAWDLPPMLQSARHVTSPSNVSPCR